MKIENRNVKFTGVLKIAEDKVIPYHRVLLLELKKKACILHYQDNASQYFKSLEFQPDSFEILTKKLSESEEIGSIVDISSIK